MFDYLVLIEYSRGMNHHIWSAREIAKTVVANDCAANTRVYRLMRNRDPQPMYISYDRKSKYFEICDRHGNLIEGVSLDARA